MPRLSVAHGFPGRRRTRSRLRRWLDALSFPLRAFTLFGGRDRWGLSSLATERFDYVQAEIGGYCLDVGCGPHNRFVSEVLGGFGVGIDVYPYEGLTRDHLIENPSRFPFDDEQFDCVTFIANLNHVPKHLRDRELAEAHRCMRDGGRIIVTMGNPIAELIVHKVIAAHDRLFGTNYDLDSVRGMENGEQYFLLDSEIRARLERAGFSRIRKKRFWTQWGLNHLLTAEKRVAPKPELERSSPAGRAGASSRRSWR